MNKFDPAALAQFTGTERYYRIAPRFLITDGVKFLADSASCFWLLDTAISHLVEIGSNDWFVVVRLVVDDSRGVLTLEDGNGCVRCKQTIPYTDFPIAQQTFYACWDGEHWVLMLTGEY